ncbi:hypothetical protein CCP3SC1AL1_2530002 [Gammaproteobacteria bacterium]
MDDEITKKEFENCFFNIFPEGNKESAYRQLQTVLNNPDPLFDGSIVTFELICNKYQEYIKWWDIKFAGIEKKWIGKGDKKKKPLDYLNDQGFRSEYIIDSNLIRDKYLLGSLTWEQLENKLNKFV